MVDRACADNQAGGANIGITPPLFDSVSCLVSDAEVSWAKAKELPLCDLVLAVTSNYQYRIDATSPRASSQGNSKRNSTNRVPGVSVA